jgi:hypothetical protein
VTRARPARTTRREKLLSFEWDKYQSSGGSYISAEEKKVLADNGIPFVVTAIKEREKFDKLHFELSIRVPNPETGDEEERVLSFPIGSGAESRDAMLAGMRKYLDENEGAEVTAKVTKVGRAFFLAQA